MSGPELVEIPSVSEVIAALEAVRGLALSIGAEEEAADIAGLIDRLRPT